jgi:hypothetical protein
VSEEKSLALVPRSITELQSMAEMLAKSTLLPDALKNKPSDVVVQILAGQELGLSPLASIRGVHIVQGKPILSADTMVGLVLASGLCEYFAQVEATASAVTFETKRKGSPVSQRCTWTMEDAKRAGLNTKDNWRLHSRQMLSARARSELARSVYPDVLAGVYVPEEHVDVRPMAPADPSVIDAEYTEAPLDPLSAVDLAADVGALKSLAPSLNKLPADQKATARARYAARMEELTKPADEPAA